MSECIFCRIAKREIPCSKIYEDDRIFAFMDINPVAIGHLLVIPKAHSTEIASMSAGDLAALGVALGKLAPAVMKAVNAEGYNILNNRGAAAGQAVDHVHFHIIPRKTGDGRGYRWITLSCGEGEIAKVAAEIVKSVS
jgi:histidine triad (HIT) family protein